MEGEIKMSTIKDIYDLIDKLRASSKDRHLLDALIPIREKVLELDKENSETNYGLQKENLELKKRINELESENTDLKKKDMPQNGIVRERFRR